MNEPHEAFDTVGDESLQARIVAWVLGESSASEAADLERLCEERPELLIFRRRLYAVHELLTQAESTEPDHVWKLPPDKRRELDKIFIENSIVRINLMGKGNYRKSGLRALFAIAACLLLAAVIQQFTSPFRSSGWMPVASGHRVGSMQSPNEDAILSHPQASSPAGKWKGDIYDVDSRIMSKNRDAGLQEVARQKQLAVKKLTDTSAAMTTLELTVTRDSVATTSRVSSAPQSGALSGPGMDLGLAQIKQLSQSVGSNRASAVTAADSIASSQLNIPQGMVSSGIPWEGVAFDRKRPDINFKGLARRNSSVSKNDSSVERERVGSFAPASPLVLSQPPPAEGKWWVDRLDESPTTENLTLRSLHLSEASFQLAKAALAIGERPDPGSIQSEQFYNAVDYGDPAPAASELVAATIEQSAYPFLPGTALVRVALRTRSDGRSALQSLRLTLLVDQSDSTGYGTRRASMMRALAQLDGLLTKNDLITVVGFARTPHLLAEGITGDQSSKLVDLVNQAAGEVGTDLKAAMKLGGEMAARHLLAGAQNRIVLFTDGSANLGGADPFELSQQVKVFRQQGISFDIADTRVDGFNKGPICELASSGNGRTYLVGGEGRTDFARQLAGSIRPAVENLKLQVRFNPQRIRKYKLLGFEQDRRTTGDFFNPIFDASELTAEEAGVAIYQVESLPGGVGEVGEVHVSFRSIDRSEMIERTWHISDHSEPTAFDRAPPSMQLAGLTLLAAEKLRGGPSADVIHFNELTVPILQVKQFYRNSPRVGEMLQVIDKLK
jgi:Domain of unknown function (DUF3520)/von Willebrand factor type A domain